MTEKENVAHENENDRCKLRLIASMIAILKNSKSDLIRQRLTNLLHFPKDIQWDEETWIFIENKLLEAMKIPIVDESFSFQDVEEIDDQFYEIYWENNVAKISDEHKSPKLGSFSQFSYLLEEEEGAKEVTASSTQYPLHDQENDSFQDIFL